MYILGIKKGFKSVIFSGSNVSSEEKLQKSPKYVFPCLKSWILLNFVKLMLLKKTEIDHVQI